MPSDPGTRSLLNNPVRVKKNFFYAGLVFELLLLVLYLARPAGGILHETGFSVVFLDREETALRIFLTEDEKYRMYRSLEEFPPGFIEAVLIHEDRYFYRHIGFNPVSLVRAAYDTYIKRKRRVGASTITMQLARMLDGLYTKNIFGKIVQIFSAIYLEMLYTKQEILEAYLNLVPCGKNIEGFPAAALFYFNKDIRDLTLSEQLLLAVIPQDPNARSPKDIYLPRELLDSRAVLFKSWIENHPEDAWLETEINMPVATINKYPFDSPHLTEYLVSRTDTAREAVITTIDSNIQERAEMHLDKYLHTKKSFGVRNGSIMILDYTTMEVLAVVGSADYFDAEIEGQVNGTAAKRSPGSTLKPFIYGLALDQGLITPQTMLKDAPTSFSEYTPDNYGNDFKGAVPAWRALTDSRNIPAIRLAQEISGPDLYQFLADYGVSGLKEREHYGLSIVLGSAELTMEELVSLYAMLANGGVKKDLKYTKSEDSDFKPSRRFLSEAASFIVLDMLEQNPSPFEFRPMESKDISVAYKTGTSIGFKDAWSIAVVDRYVICVWIGNFDGLGNNAFLGREMAVPLLFLLIDDILSQQGTYLSRREPPETVKKVALCDTSGLLPNDHCPETMESWYIPGVSPIEKCDIHRQIYIDTRTGYRTDDKTGPFVKAAVREFWPSDLLELFSKAGLPRIVPPPYPPDEFIQRNMNEGFPPEIISPLEKTEYFLCRTNPERNRIVLQAASDADAKELFWFADNIFIGRSEPNESLVWTPQPGAYEISVLDSTGRSDTIEINVFWQAELEE